MAKLSEYEQNALAFRLIDSITTASPNEVVRVLSENGFAEQFKFGVNPSQAIIILQQLWVGNRPKFLQLVKQMKIDTSRIPPSDVDAYKQIAKQNNPNAKIDVPDWINNVWNSFSEKTTTGESETTTSETTTGAYIGYVVVIIAIIVITVYLMRTVK